MKLQPYFSKALELCETILMGIGLYFELFPPPLLLEDVRSIVTSFTKIQDNIPHFLTWLNNVFGCIYFTSGLLTLYVAVTSFRTRARGVTSVMAFAGFTPLVG